MRNKRVRQFSTDSSILIGDRRTQRIGDSNSFSTDTLNGDRFICSGVASILADS
jgi:hypothetical protein